MNKRLCSILLVLVLVLGMMSGCSKDPSDPVDDPVENNQTDQDNVEQNNDVIQAPEYAYQALISSLSDKFDASYSVDQIKSFCVSGDTAFFSAECLDGAADADTYVDPVSGEAYADEELYRTDIFAVNLETLDLTRVDYVPSELEEGREGTRTLSAVYAGRNNSVWLIETVESYYFDLPADFDAENGNEWDYYTVDKPVTTLLHFDANGDLLSSAVLSTSEDVGSFYNVIADFDGNVYASDYSTVYLYDTDGNEIAALDVADGYLKHFGVQGVGYVTYAGSNQCIQMIDPAEGTLGEVVEVNSNAWTLKEGSAEYAYSYIHNGVIFGQKPDEDSPVQILDLLSCDINSNKIFEYALLDEGEIIALETVTDESNEKLYNIIQLSLVDISGMPQKQELTLAALRVDNRLREDVIAFNKSQDDARIVVKDYSFYNSADNAFAGLEQLNQEISEGNLPDLIMTDDLPVLKYAEQGILVDLWTLIETDSTLSRDDLMTHLFDTVSVDGKLYEASAWFTVSAAAGSKETIGNTDLLTFDAAQNALSNLNADATFFGASKDSVINHYLNSILLDYVDYSASKSSYNSKSFVELLDYLKLVYEQAASITGQKSTDYRRLATQKQLLSAHSLDGLYAVKYANALHRGNAVFSGFPTSDGEISTFELINPVVITTSCSSVDLAWQFVRTYLTTSYQTEGESHGFPTNQNAFNVYAEKLMTPVYTTDSDGNQIEVSNGTMKLDEILVMQLYAVTQEEYELFTALYETCNRVNRTDAALKDLVYDELMIMFNENRSAADTAAAIQTAVDTHLAS